MKLAVVAPSLAQGGAARAARRLVEGYAQAGAEVACYSGQYEPGATCFTAPGFVSASALNLLHAAGEWTQGARRTILARRPRQLARSLAQAGAQAIHLHGFNQWDGLNLPLEVVAGLAAVGPVLWTLHDAWPLNGRLDYPELGAIPATGWTTGALETALRELLDSPAPGWVAQRQRIAGLRQFAFVAPSAWLADHARRVWADRVRCEAIANVVDPAIFHPHDPALARAALGWRADRALVLLAAADWQATRKGGALWADAAARLRTPFDLAVIGDGQLPAQLAGPGQVHRLGRVGDDRLLALAYAAADVTVVPSLLDNLPNILLESLACGTPCAGFRIGGLPEAIRPGETGALAEAISGPALAAGVEDLLTSVRRDRGGWSARCAAFARAHYDPVQQARRHLSLLEELRHDVA